MISLLVGCKQLNCALFTEILCKYHHFARRTTSHTILLPTWGGVSVLALAHLVLAPPPWSPLVLRGAQPSAAAASKAADGAPATSSSSAAALRPQLQLAEWLF